MALAESNGSLPPVGFMTHVTCRLTAKNRDQLQYPTLGSRVWATFTFIIGEVSGEGLGCLAPPPKKTVDHGQYFALMLFKLLLISLSLLLRKPTLGSRVWAAFTWFPCDCSAEVL